MITRDSATMERLRQQANARFVVTAHQERDFFDVVDAVLDGRVVVGVGGLDVRLNRRWVALLFRTCRFLDHVGATYELAAKDVAASLRTPVALLQELQAIVAVELVGVEHHAALLVVAPHHLIGELVDGSLEPALFGVDVDFDAAFRCGLTHLIEALDDACEHRVVGLIKADGAVVEFLEVLVG